MRFITILGAILMALVAAVPAALAQPAIGSCSGSDHAPAAFDNAACDGDNGSSALPDDFCTLNAGSDTMTCGGSNDFSNVEAWAVYDYDEVNGDISAWGTVDYDSTTYTFCCVLTDADDATDVGKVILAGSSTADHLAFAWGVGGNWLNPHISSQQLKAIIYGGGGDDEIEGSHTTSSDYQEWLYGEGGNDTIYGFDGDDYISGGDGDDEIHAGPGNDRAWGDGGVDKEGGGVRGGDDEDCVVDMITCPQGGGNSLKGGDNDDILWMGYDGTGCATAFTVDGEDEDIEDTCGDSDHVSGTWISCEAWIADFDTSCAIPTP